MIISVVKEGRNKIIVEHDTELLSFECKNAWRTIHAVDSRSPIYDPLNKYIATLPDDVQESIFNLYKDAIVTFTELHELSELNVKLTKIVTDLTLLIDYDDLSEWVLSECEIAYNDDIKEEYKNSYALDETLYKKQTYLKDAYDDLVVLSFIFKLITPIWGGFISGLSDKEIENSELLCLNMMDDTYIYDIPAMKRLTDYCGVITEKHSSMKLTSVIITKMPMSKLPDFILAVVIIKRVAVSQLYNPDNTIIKSVFNQIESTVNKLTENYHDKESTTKDLDDKGESITEKYRVSQTITDGDIVIASSYLKNLEHVARDFALDLDDIDVDTLVQKAYMYEGILEDLVEIKFDYIAKFTSALIMDTVVEFHLLEMVDREAAISALAMTAAWLSERNKPGYRKLANMITSDRVLKSEMSGKGHHLGGIALEPITADNREKLISIYTHVPAKLNLNNNQTPFDLNMDEYIRMVNSYDWPNKKMIPLNLRNILIELLMYREEEIKNGTK